MIKQGLSALLIACFSWQALADEAQSAAYEAAFKAQQVQVYVPQLKQVFGYNQPVPLLQVLDDAAQSLPATYPLAIKLFGDKEQEVEDRRLKVVQSLHHLPAHQEQVADNLLSQISSHQYGNRLFTMLDRDVLRLEPNLNILLSGRYQLELPSRPNSVMIYGLVQQAQSLPYQAKFVVSDYLKQPQIIPLEMAAKSKAWVLQPDGEFYQTGVAYYNDSQARVPPGSIIFVGFEESAYQQLEQDILVLLASIKG